MLIPKVEQRIKQYLDLLEKNAYKKIEDLKFEMFEADKINRQPPASLPANAEWQKIETPAPWGKEWKCFWFRTSYHAPKSDKALFLSVTPNADSLAFIDGKPAGAFNMYHNKIRIDADGKDHTLHVESYSGHMYSGCGPFEGSSIVINIGKTIPNLPNTFEGGCLLERRQAVHTLFYDIRALYETANIADPNSLRKAKIIKGISDALAVVSLSADGDELEKQSAAALKILSPLLALKNSPTVPSVHLIGHAHIDHAWLWHIEETERKCARTFVNMLRFMKEYPEFIFVQSQPCQLEIIKNEYPEIFEEIKQAYKKGQWEPNGGMWVESDCNVVSGESLVRQFLVGKKVNKELLDYEADTLWLPDVFGYAAALPQIMEGCRIKYFVTSKINWNDTTRFPYETFIWRGIDGTGVKAHFLSTLGSGAGYNGRVVPQELHDIWASVQHKEVQSACVKSIGEGDGGGGTLRADIEMARRLGDLEGAPRAAWKTLSSALGEIFSEDKEGTFPEWCGELYLELHRATYTTQARTKRYNRLMEFALRNMEFLVAFAEVANSKTGINNKEINATILDYWKRILTSQFHDIIPGSSITRVYTEAEADYCKMLSELDVTGTDAKKRLVGFNAGDDCVAVFNDLSWEYTPVVNVCETQSPVLPAALSCADGKVYPAQQYTHINGKKRAAFAVKAPSLGWTNYKIVKEAAPNSQPSTLFLFNNNTLETPFHTIKFDNAGRIVSLFEKKWGYETVACGGAFNSLITAEDIPVFWDAWDIDADWTKRIKQETGLVSTEVISDGPVFFRLRRTYKISDVSQLVQDMVCYADNPRIDFETKVDWHEKWRVLKVEFDTAISAAQVRCEVQYGHLWRNTHRNLMQDRAKFEICAHKWISLEEEGGGVALLNDCKYGHDVEGGKMRLTLLRSPIAPDPEADRGEHWFTYSILPFSGHFGDSGVIHSSYELNSPASAVFGSGDILQTQSLCSVDGNSVIIECIKVPENANSGEIILRLYESLGGKCRTSLHFSHELISAAETDMLEDNPKPIPVQGKKLDLEFRAFEIKTIRVKFTN
ncbi:MAG: glycosyl hydrolase-related protein [Treponema sp.]|nr:glycosyl hydrolase-related protein [Treponema sp.]